jgi:GNAT superfamily N-acetyltransferase
VTRFALLSDVSDVAVLYHSIWHETHAEFMPDEECARRTLAFFEERMRALLPTTLVEEQEGTIMAFSSWNGPLLGQMFVTPAYRGTGLASYLMATTEYTMASKGVRKAELHCVVGNVRARRFYERAGWCHDGEILEEVAGRNGRNGVPFWRLVKVLPAPNG